MPMSPPALRAPTVEGLRTALWGIPVSDLAGVARHTLDVVRVGIPGWKIVVLCPPGPLAKRLEDEGATFAVGAFGPEAGPFRSVRTLRGMIRDYGPEIVHTHLSYADLVASVAAIGTGVKWITTEHGIAGDDSLYHSSRAKARGRALAHHERMRRLDGQIAVSRSTLRTLRESWHPPARVPSVVIPNGVDAGRVSNSTRPAGLRIGSISRLVHEKSLDTLIDAFADLLSDHPEATLTLAGNGPLAAELAERCRRLGVAEAVSFPGHVDAAEQLAKLDVVVQLSHWENCSYTLLDAVVAGCGVVATDVGGNPEILPTQSLVHRSSAGVVDIGEVARKIARQGLDPSTRPDLPDAWPSVTDMAGDIGKFYDRLCGVSAVDAGIAAMAEGVR